MYCIRRQIPHSTAPWEDCWSWPATRITAESVDGIAGNQAPMTSLNPAEENAAADDKESGVKSDPLGAFNRQVAGKR